jgi:hypothetical protein
MRWVDDGFYAFKLNKHQCSLQFDKNKLLEAIQKLYFPFSIKEENAEEFVGLSISMGYTINPLDNPDLRIPQIVCSLLPKGVFPNPYGNFTINQIKGFIGGGIIRAIDSSSNTDALFVSIYRIFQCLTVAGYSQRHFHSVIRKYTKKYCIMEMLAPAFRIFNELGIQ